MARQASVTLQRFASDERGTIAIIFSLCIFIVMGIVGLAIDVGRLFHANSKIAASIDAAALAAAKSLRLSNLSDAGVKDMAQNYFSADLAGSGGNYAKIDSFNVVINRDKGSVEVDVKAKVPTVFGRVAGVESFTIPKSSTAVFESKDIEVGVQLDMTGSMGGKKIADLKAATNTLLDILLPDAPTGQKVRVGFAPFSAGVNAGAYLKAVDGNRASVNNCVYERRQPANEKTDAPPTLLADSFKIKSDLAGAVQDCPAATVEPLTDQKNLLKARVNTFNAISSTAGQLGASWAWYLVSPNWASIWPASAKPANYGDKQTIKTVILMTDGVYNTIGGVNYGDGSAQAVQASKLSVDICNAMKAKDKGIVVYTVGFDVNNAGAQKQRVIDTLTACASDPAKFYRAESGAELEAAFREIANDIISLRLAK